MMEEEAQAAAAEQQLEWAMEVMVLVVAVMVLQGRAAVRMAAVEQQHGQSTEVYNFIQTRCVLKVNLIKFIHSLHHTYHLHFTQSTN